MGSPAFSLSPPALPHLLYSVESSSLWRFHLKCLKSVPLPSFLGSDLRLPSHHLGEHSSFSSCFSPSPLTHPRMLPGDLFQDTAFLVPSLFWLLCRPPLPLFNGFSLSDSSLVSLWSSSTQPAWPAVSDTPSLTSSCPRVHPCLSASEYQAPHLSETSSGPLGQGKTLLPDH